MTQREYEIKLQLKADWKMMEIQDAKARVI